MLRQSCSKGSLRSALVAVKVALALLVAVSSLIGAAAEEGASTPLHRALQERDYDAAIQLLRSGADATAESAEGELPLVVAADDGSADAFDVVRELLRFGARSYMEHPNGDTALHRAARRGNMAVVELLVRHGADVNASRTRDTVVGKLVDTPLSLAYAYGHFRVGEYLESMGARAPENEDIETYKDLGRIEERIDAFLDRPPPGNIDAEEWRRVAIKTAFAEVQPELARWFEEVEQMNPEAMEMFNAVAEEAPPPGMDELEWAHHQFARVQQMIQSGELTIEVPRPPPD